MNLKEPDETWKIDIDLMTKDGRPIEMFYNTNVEVPNRGYECDEIIAYVNGEKAGYLKVQNIPARNLAIFYPSGPISHAYHILGERILPYDMEETKPIDIKTADLDVLNAMIAGMERYGINHGHPSGHKFSSREEFDIWFKKYLDKKSIWFKKRKKDFADFCEFNVDKPFVAYTSTRNPNKGLHEQSWEGLGIAKAMYFAMAFELEKQGLALRRSTVLFKGAAELWQSFERRGLTITGGVFEGEVQPILSPEKIREKLNISLAYTNQFKR